LHWGWVNSRSEDWGSSGGWASSSVIDEHASGSVEHSLGWLNEMSSVSPGNTSWSNVGDSTSGSILWSSSVSWKDLASSGFDGVVIVGWHSINSVVNASWSLRVPRLAGHWRGARNSGDSKLEWLFWCTSLFVFPPVREISHWSDGLISSVNVSVLELLNLMLMVWDVKVRLPNWIVDLGSFLWHIWSSDWWWVNWSHSRSMWALAGSNNSVTQISLKWDSLASSCKVRIEVTFCIIPCNVILAVWKLNPSSSHSGSNPGSCSSRNGSRSLKENILSMLVLELLKLLREVFVSVNSVNESGIKVDGLGSTDKNGHSK